MWSLVARVQSRLACLFPCDFLTWDFRVFRSKLSPMRCNFSQSANTFSLYKWPESWGNPPVLCWILYYSDDRTTSKTRNTPRSSICLREWFARICKSPFPSFLSRNSPTNSDNKNRVLWERKPHLQIHEPPKLSIGLVTLVQLHRVHSHR